jgi:hypothetical protein
MITEAYALGKLLERVKLHWRRLGCFIKNMFVPQREKLQRLLQIAIN